MPYSRGNHPTRWREWERESNIELLIEFWSHFIHPPTPNRQQQKSQKIKAGFKYCWSLILTWAKPYTTATPHNNMNDIIKIHRVKVNFEEDTQWQYWHQWTDREPYTNKYWWRVYHIFSFLSKIERRTLMINVHVIMINFPSYACSFIQYTQGR